MAHTYLPPSPASATRRGKRVALGVVNSDDESTRPTAAMSHRMVSASEVARSVKHFETWAAHQRCEQVAFSDLPGELRVDVAYVFDLSGRIPSEWILEGSSWAQHMKALSPNLLEFLRSAHNHDPELFSDSVSYDLEETHQLFEELTTVRLAWNRLKNMRQSGQKWSEADYAANVYNMFRSPTINRSIFRHQCSISLPEPPERPKAEAYRILYPKSAIPDGTTFIKPASIRHLSHSLKSPYKVLNAHPSIAQYSRLRVENTFRFQATPCSQPPETACFEFVSSIWEDKKPSHELLEHAYRQNRMATASALRMLHSLRIESCIFGLIWAEGTVRAHIDWYASETDAPIIYSAPYPGPEGDEAPKVFHEWNLDLPSGILQVYFLLRNIDIWTADHFRQRVTHGVQTFSEGVSVGQEEYLPWKRLTDSRLKTVTEGKENATSGGSLFPGASRNRGRSTRRTR
ncbi:hypothetical protein M422DRAFT_46219 [Sphaerobolus stellatus SS14]|nr:hypothetical protein M422DRAFT_46219 [Sphaerobolus stellatus SS14]